jgi:hypothetical protein
MESQNSQWEGQPPNPPMGEGQPPNPPMGEGQSPNPPMGEGQPPNPPIGGLNKKYGSKSPKWGI